MSGTRIAASAPPKFATARSSPRAATIAFFSTAIASCGRISSPRTAGSPSPAGSSAGNRIAVARADRESARREADAGNLELRRLGHAALARRHQPPVGRCCAAARAVAPAAATTLAGRAVLQSRDLARAISTASTASMPIIAAGARKIPISSCACCTPACAARTACLRPASCICGTRRPIGRILADNERQAFRIIAGDRHPRQARAVVAASRLQRRKRGLTDDRISRNQDCSTGARLARAADWLVVAVAVSLPWSTSATSILLVLWLLALIPDARLGRRPARTSLTPAGGLPVLLCRARRRSECCGPTSRCSRRWHGFEFFFKLLVIPLLFVQFRRFRAADYAVFGGYARFLRRAAAGVDACRIRSRAFFHPAALGPRAGEKRRHAKRRIRHLHFRSLVFDVRLY